MSLFGFPNPVNEVAARLVAGVVAITALLAVVTHWHWLLLPLAYGFIARVLAGPRFSPLGLLVTRVVVPRLAIRERPVPGPPKRFAQGIGAVITIAAVVLDLGLGLTTAGTVLLGMLVAAATLESVVGFCVGCQGFALLMRTGIIPVSVCEACNAPGLRRATG